MVIIGIILILFGALITFVNWRLIYEWYKYKRRSSQLPLMGGLSLSLGLYCLCSKPIAFLAMLADPGTLVCFYAIPFLIKNAWQTSRFRIENTLVAKTEIACYTLKLFKSGVFILKVDFDPPQKCNEHGANILADSMQGNWKNGNDSILLFEYRDNREIILTGVNDSTYISKELNYPEDKPYKYDSLDSIEFVIEQ